MKVMVSLFIVLTSTMVWARGIPGVEDRTDLLRQKYASLYQLKVQRLPDGTRKFHNGTLFFREGLRVLSLKGDRFEMAFQHGKLLQEEIPQGVIGIASEMIRNEVDNAFGDKPF